MRLIRTVVAAPDKQLYVTALYRSDRALCAAIRRYLHKRRVGRARFIAYLAPCCLASRGRAGQSFAFGFSQADDGPSSQKQIVPHLEFGISTERLRCESADRAR